MKGLGNCAVCYENKKAFNNIKIKMEGIMRKKAKFNWDDVIKVIVVLKDGRRITLGEKEINSIISALTLAAVHGFGRH